jgi:hypothetical protein
VHTKIVVGSLAVALLAGAGATAGALALDEPAARDCSRVTPAAADAPVSAATQNDAEGAAGWGPLRIGDYSDITALLPNVIYKRDGQAKTAADRVLNGKVVAVEPGRAFDDFDEGPGAEQTKDTPRHQELDFDDPAADWRTVHLTVDVLEQIGHSSDTSETVRVGLAVGGSNIARLRKELTGARSYVFFLQRNSAVFAYDRTIYATARDGTLLTEVHDDCTLSLPRLDGNDAEEARWLSRARTLGQLKAAAEEPESVREVRPWPDPAS